MKTRIMYIENKADGISGPARIGRVAFSKSGKSFHYRGRTFSKMKGGFKANCLSETGEEYWVSGCKRMGAIACTAAPSRLMMTSVRNTGLRSGACPRRRTKKRSVRWGNTAIKQHVSAVITQVDIPIRLALCCVYTGKEGDPNI